MRWLLTAAVVLIGCPGPDGLVVADAGDTDAGDPDAGATDAGVVDAGTPDAGQSVDAGSGLSYRRDIQPIWNQWCVGCHSATTRQPPLLEAGASRQSLLGVQSTFCFWTADGGISPMGLLVPGEPELSGVLQITNADRQSARCLDIMPRMTTGLRALAPAQWESVRRWVAEGAQDN